MTSEGASIAGLSISSDTILVLRLSRPVTVATMGELQAAMHLLADRTGAAAGIVVEGAEIEATTLALVAAAIKQAGGP